MIIRRSTRNRAIIVSLAVVAAVCGYYIVRIVYKSDGPLNFRVVTPGVVSVSGQPDAEDLARQQDTYGFETLVDVRAGVLGRFSRRYRTETEFARTHGVRFVQIPVESRSAPSADQIEEFLSLMKDPQSYPVWLHCNNGNNRSVFFAAVYRVEFENWSVAQAYRDAIKMGLDLRSHPEIAKALRDYRPTGDTGQTRPASGSKESVETAPIDRPK